MGFVGRTVELGELGHLLEDVRQGGRADRGLAVLLRGRRRVGKSRMVTEFIRTSRTPSVYFQAARGAARRDDYAHLAAAIAESDLPLAAVAQGNQPASLTAALTLLAASLPSDAASVVVLDEIPWLLEGEPGGAGELQRVWDQQLSAKPVLLLLLGSDLAMMKALNEPSAPFHDRAKEMVLGPLTPRDIGTMTGLSGMAVFDAYLITGGLPLIAQEWPKGTPVQTFMEASFERSTSALVVSGSRILDTEFPGRVPARAVLTAIGGLGERTFTGIQNKIHASSAPSTLNNALDLLRTKRVIAADEPLSTSLAAKNRRWRIEDPALRFWLAFVEPSLSDIDRGRNDLALARFQDGFASWRGRAIEPITRTALSRLLPDEAWPTAKVVGAWWPRNNNPEIDLIAANRYPAEQIAFVGTIKWRSRGPVTTLEVDKLATEAVLVPGVTAATPLVAVHPTGRCRDPRIATTWSAADLLGAWK